MESAPEKSVAQKVERSERAASGPVSVSELPVANELLRIPRLAGNMAMQRLLREGGIQPKLKVGAPGDAYEQEADRIAEQVITAAPSSVAQRKCACSSASSDTVCASCAREQVIQPKLKGSQRVTSMSAANISGLRNGRPLDREIRSFMEARFNRDFGDVRLHTDREAADSAASINARAFTLNNDVVFAQGQYNPFSVDGQRLLAHELTHVVQQGQAQRCGVIRRQTTGETTPGTAAPTPQPAKSTALIVDDSTEDVEPHQMKRSMFLAQLRGAVASTVLQTLSSVPFAFAMRDYIGREAKQQFNQYTGLDARTLENLARRKVPGADSATSAAALIPLICARVRQAIEAYITTAVKQKLAGAEEFGGTIGGEIGSSVGGVIGGAIGSALGSEVGGAISTAGNLLFKAKDGGPRRPDDPRVIRGQLRGGKPLDSRLQSEFSSVYGRDFSGVRIHADSGAAALASQLNARAFTYGQDIAFSHGEYKPGTLFGDALIAHELAHVAQQNGGNSGSAVMSKDTGSEEAFETDADMAAVGAMVSLWGGFKGEVSRIVRRVGPSLRSGLKLRRCPFFEDCNTKTTGPDAGPTPTASGKPVPPPPPKLLNEQFPTVPKRNEAIQKVVTDLGIDRTKVDVFYDPAAAAGAALHTKKGVWGLKKSQIQVFEGAFLDGWPLLVSSLWHEYQHELHQDVSKAAGEVEAYCQEIITQGRNYEKEEKVGVIKQEIKFGKKIVMPPAYMTGKEYVRDELWVKVEHYWNQCTKKEKATLQPLFNEAKKIVDSLPK